MKKNEMELIPVGLEEIGYKRNYSGTSATIRRFYESGEAAVQVMYNHASAEIARVSFANTVKRLGLKDEIMVVAQGQYVHD